MLDIRLRIALAIVAAVVPLSARLPQQIKVSGGLVSGTTGKDSSISVFKGLPFAAPPVGDLRWRAPQLVAPWPGVRKTDHFSASCMQTIRTEFKPWTYEFMTHNEISEDCLYLNVWTPAKSAGDNLPVYVYILAGGTWKARARCRCTTARDSRRRVSSS